MYSRFILRVLPAEVVCYASEEEITRAVTPLVEKYFPKESPSGHKVSFLLDCWMVWLGQNAETIIYYLVLVIWIFHHGVTWRGDLGRPQRARRGAAGRDHGEAPNPNLGRRHRRRL